MPDAAVLQARQAPMRKFYGHFGAKPQQLNGDDDHVHMLVDYPLKAAVAGLVNSLKCVSARKLRLQFTGRVNRHTTCGHLCSPPYLSHPVASCGGAR